MKIKKTHVKTENNFTIYDTWQHNECVICSKLIMSQFLSTLDVRKRVVGCILLLAFSILHIPQLKLTIHTSPPQSPQAALRVAELVPTAKMSKKILIN